MVSKNNGSYDSVLLLVLMINLVSKAGLVLGGLPEPLWYVNDDVLL